MKIENTERVSFGQQGHQRVWVAEEAPQIHDVHLRSTVSLSLFEPSDFAVHWRPIERTGFNAKCIQRVEELRIALDRALAQGNRDVLPIIAERLETSTWSVFYHPTDAIRRALFACDLIVRQKQPSETTIWEGVKTYFSVPFALGGF